MAGSLLFNGRTLVAYYFYFVWRRAAGFSIYIALLALLLAIIYY